MQSLLDSIQACQRIALGERGTRSPPGARHTRLPTRPAKESTEVLGYRNLPLMRSMLTLVASLMVATQAVRASEPTFERDILPILNAHCLQCHGGLHQKGKLDLRTLAGITTGGRGGKAIEPGHPEKSLLWQRIASDEMPPRPSTEDCLMTR